jgi:hypothetical protein
MFTTIQDRHLQFMGSASGAIALFFLLSFSGAVFGQNTASLQDNANKPTEKPATSAHQPVNSVYKGVKIGASADEVRNLLGKAKIDDNDGFFYDRDSEMIQIRLDEDKKVRLIAVTYSSESPNTPEYADIFGVEPADAKPDGSLYTLVRYPDLGYWIAYSKTAGEKPSVTVTMQKL